MDMLFVMDPLKAINVKKDTTFAFMMEAQRRGHGLWVCETRDLSATPARGYALASRVEVRAVEGDHFTVIESARRDLESFPTVWMRKDPPFDMAFLYATFLLEQVDPSKCLVINRPRGLRDANEKAYILNFGQFTPDTLVTRSREEILRFVAEVGGKAVIKPLDQMGGTGIFLLREDDANLNSIIETSTHFGEETIMVQRYVPEAAQGDKRIVLMDGEPLGAILRVPSGKEFRGNMAAGGRAQSATITEREREIIDAVVPRLREDGIWFVGLDVLGDYLTEVNVTSPTGVQEINRLDGVACETVVIDWAEANAPG
jgi:glutathione synthase